MRTGCWVGGLVGWLGLAGALGAQTNSSPFAKVSVPLAEVRGGPSDIFPLTGRLCQGQSVPIVGEQNGFFAITPPPGSSSWIDDAALRHSRTPTLGKPFDSLVNLDNAPVRLGSPFFFSSRRRHTSCLSDWSSDVCSSD